MSFTLVLPENYNYVILVASGSMWLNTLHFFLDVSARKKSGLKYPIAYASQELAAKDNAAYQFNCAQRAHLNLIENYTGFLLGLFVSGLRYPVLSASLGGLWTLARLHYALGYTSSAGPQGRTIGATVSLVADLVLKVTATFSAIMFVI